MPVELIVFDLAGTTVKDNSDVHRVMQKALKRFEVEISLGDANTVMGLPKPIAIYELIKERYDGLRPITQEWINDVHHEFVAEMVKFYKTDPGVAEKEGVTETFKKLKQRKLKIAVDTGFDRQITECILERLGWRRNNLLDASVTSDEVSRGRPFPDLIYKAMELTNVTDCRSVAKVGDTASDLREGTSAGCGWVIGVTTGAYSKTQLEKEKHTHLIEKVHEVIEIFELSH